MTKALQTDGLSAEDKLAIQQFHQTGLYGPDVSGLATQNPAVARCCQAFTKAFLATVARAPNEQVMARVNAEEAYRKAMPPLHGSRNIRNFLACVAHGILVDAIEKSRSTRLVYAAQVAHTIRRGKSGAPGKFSPVQDSSSTK